MTRFASAPHFSNPFVARLSEDPSRRGVGWIYRRAVPAELHENILSEGNSARNEARTGHGSRSAAEPKVAGVKQRQTAGSQGAEGGNSKQEGHAKCGLNAAPSGRNIRDLPDVSVRGSEVRADARRGGETRSVHREFSPAPPKFLRSPSPRRSWRLSTRDGSVHSQKDFSARSALHQY